jgi:hypothetical protein
MTTTVAKYEQSRLLKLYAPAMYTGETFYSIKILTRKCAEDRIKEIGVYAVADAAVKYCLKRLGEHGTVLLNLATGRLETLVFTSVGTRANYYSHHITLYSWDDCLPSAFSKEEVRTKKAFAEAIVFYMKYDFNWECINRQFDEIYE